MVSDAAPVTAPETREAECALDASAATQRASWRSLRGLSSGLGGIERFLAHAGFDRAPWLAVAFGCGIAAWFALPLLWQWATLLVGAIAGAGLVLIALGADGRWPFARLALAGFALALAAGCAIAWVKSAMVGAPGIARPYVGTVTGRVIARQDRPADAEIRLVAAIHSPVNPGQALRVRIRMPVMLDQPGLSAGALFRAKVRLMPPAAPLLPGGHDYARTAWFHGIAATGTVLAPLEIAAPGRAGGELGALRARLSEHVTARIAGSEGGIAAAFVSGDRGAIARADEDALRDAGLSHLLSVSGLHVSAVVAATYLVVARLLALFPWLALRLRVPLMASGGAALAGVLYTLLTGAEVPTVRSMVGALLVLIALALGREPLSLRLLAIAAFVVMLVWPEAVVGPSFQLSFGAVLAIVALHGTSWMRTFSTSREEPWWQAGSRKLAILLITGVVIELALLPIGLFHFHRAGIYGALANVIAIPLTTFVIMPLEALGLLLDLAGLGGAVWWLVGQALSLLLALARAIAGQPGAIALLPAMGGATYALFLGGGLWLALWQGRARLWGLLPIVIGSMWLATLRPPDVLVANDGRHVGIAGLLPGRLIFLRSPRSTYAGDMLNEMAATEGPPLVMDQWPDARCNTDFCGIDLQRGGRVWRLLISRGDDPVPVRDLSAACERTDIIISDRWLPRSCHPAFLKADKALLARTGGLAIDLTTGTIAATRAPEDDHGWRVR